MGRLCYARDKLPRIIADFSRRYNATIDELSHCEDNVRSGYLLSRLEQEGEEAKAARAQLAKVLEAIEGIAQYATWRKQNPSLPPISRESGWDRE